MGRHIYPLNIHVVLFPHNKLCYSQRYLTIYFINTSSLLLNKLPILRYGMVNSNTNTPATHTVLKRHTIEP